jgi:hypothetical protein
MHQVHPAIRWYLKCRFAYFFCSGNLGIGYAQGKSICVLLGVWIVSSIFWKISLYYLSKSTGLQLPTTNSGDEYLFITGIIYIISQIFKRGIEIQEENQLTV